MKTVRIETLKIITSLPGGRWPLALKTILVWAALMVLFEPVVQARKPESIEGAVLVGEPVEAFSETILRPSTERTPSL